MLNQAAIKEKNQRQPENQEINIVNQPLISETTPSKVEDELAECLKVDSGSESDCSVLSRKHIPRTLKTRKAIIRKIQETAVHLGNESEIKTKRIHRMRKNSLDHLLKEQVGRLVQRQAESSLGIPQEHDKRLEYAVSCLYKFDICCMKLLEKCIDYANLGVTVEGLASTIDTDSAMKTEIKDALRDFIIESDLDWVKEAASPTTRLLLCHLYPLCSVLRRAKSVQTNKEIFPGMHGAVATAKLRSVFRPPRNDSVPEVTRPPTLPSSVKLV